MRKMNGRGRFPVETIGRAIMNCRPMKALTAKVKDILAQTDVERLRTLCIVLMASMLIGDVVLLIRTGDRMRAAPHYSVIRPVTTGGAERRQISAKTFGQVWDSLMANPVTKKRWDSLLQLRPGLRDTIRQMKRMDSAVSGR